MKKIFILLFSLLLITACSSTGMSYKERNAAYLEYINKHNIEALDRISTFTYQGWQSLTDEFLIIRTRVKDRYLIQLNGYCPDLSFANAIKINQGMGSTLVTKFDSISVIGAKQPKCYIKNIYPLSKEQVKEISAIGKSTSTNEE